MFVDGVGRGHVSRHVKPSTHISIPFVAKEALRPTSRTSTDRGDRSAAVTSVGTGYCCSHVAVQSRRSLSSSPLCQRGKGMPAPRPELSVYTKGDGSLLSLHYARAPPAPPVPRCIPDSWPLPARLAPPPSGAPVRSAHACNHSSRTALTARPPRAPRTARGALPQGCAQEEVPFPQA